MNAGDYLNKEVTVIDLSNYVAEYSKNEEDPMKAILFEITEYPCFWVRSIKTGNEYELYQFQIKEFKNLWFKSNNI